MRTPALSTPDAGERASSRRPVHRPPVLRGPGTGAAPASAARLHGAGRLGRFLIALGLAVLAFSILLMLGQSSAASRASSRVESMEVVSEPAGETPVAVAPLIPHLGQLLGRVAVPSRGIDAPIRYGASERVLRSAAGVVPGTALPGAEVGNLVLAGHRDALFASLRFVAVGDRIVLESIVGEGRKQRDEYRVVSTRVIEADDFSVLGPPTDSHAELTLLTCYPFGFVGPAPRRYAVRAVLVERADD